MKRALRGFTLLELMVAIAILIIVSAIITQTLPFILSEVRDNRRIDALTTMQRVIELYRADTGVYPPFGGSSPPPAGGYAYATVSDGFATGLSNVTLQAPTAAYIPNVMPTYYEQLPQDPLPGLSTDQSGFCGGDSRNYVYISDGNNYKLIFNCADETGIDSTDQFADEGNCLGATCGAWAVSNNMDCVTFGISPCDNVTSPSSGYPWP
jgi:prepilin-type N-terminal cleavage/methylation domain-containing protein